MATELSRKQLFEPALVTDLVNKVKGRSSLAKLSVEKPVPFNGNKIFTFTLDSDIDVVAENGKKTHGGISLEPKNMVPIKVEYGARVSDEFMYASEEVKIDILKSFNEGFAKKLARGLDIMALHGFNPRTKQASAVIGENHFDAAVTQKVVKTTNPDADIEAAVGMVQGADGIVTGIAMDPSFSTLLAKVTNGDNGAKMYPELSWGANPDRINGLQSDVNNTISFTTNNLAIVGDFENMFKWGYAKEVQFEVIEYGDPDNSDKDLKGYNQVYLRAEAYLGWAIMDGSSFARIASA